MRGLAVLLLVACFCSVAFGDCENTECPRACPGEYEFDEDGCNTCLCKGCNDAQCRIYCPLGFTTDANGCESFCTCNTRETVCQNVVCSGKRVCNPRSGRCE
uniref:Therostasin n=1 Tax=Theromyzon tessulatum TaxID=13286 RepID=THST_THETS|nr:RecName: Full=Therostasin; Flags: Precursor [Theromyzon tessulatum]AAF73958.1 factor Xa inhibitor therostasin [Theromyzon tessulatum]